MSAAPLKVLVIDDEPPIRRLLRTGLATEGYEALEAATGAEALALMTRKPDLVVLDPPRPGVEAEALARLKKLTPSRIHYLSCDPATLARDLALLVGTEESPGAFTIHDINLFDIFPQTYHMEVLVRLKRRM